jgi:uncharacterized protein (TIGR00251 family)
VPGSRTGAIERGTDGLLRVRVAAPPVEGKANRELIRFLAARLDLPPSAVRLVKGAGSRHKSVDIEGLTRDEIERRLIGSVP